MKPAISVTRAFLAPHSAASGGVVVVSAVFPVDVVAIREMRVEIDEPGQQRGGAEIDHRGAGRHRERGGDLLDMLADDPHHRRLERRAAAAVDQPGGLDDDRLRRKTMQTMRARSASTAE